MQCGEIARADAATIRHKKYSNCSWTVVRVYPSACDHDKSTAVRVRAGHTAKAAGQRRPTATCGSGTKSQLCVRLPVRLCGVPGCTRRHGSVEQSSQQCLEAGAAEAKFGVRCGVSGSDTHWPGQGRTSGAGPLDPTSVPATPPTWRPCLLCNLPMRKPSGLRRPRLGRCRDCQLPQHVSPTAQPVAFGCRWVCRLAKSAIPQAPGSTCHSCVLQPPTLHPKKTVAPFFLLQMSHAAAASRKHLAFPPRFFERCEASAGSAEHE